MKGILAILSLVSLMGGSAFAAKVTPAGPATKGINESVTISHLENGVWGYTFQSIGFTMGTVRVSLVPVTREAAQVLQSLDKSASYNCVLENSTYLDLGPLKEAFYVLDINCD